MDREGFETGLGPWTIADPPPGSSPGTGPVHPLPGSCSRPAVRTRDTVLLGFGVEQVAAPAEQSALLRRAFTSVGLR